MLARDFLSFSTLQLSRAQLYTLYKSGARLAPGYSLLLGAVIQLSGDVISSLLWRQMVFLALESFPQKDIKTPDF